MNINPTGHRVLIKQDSLLEKDDIYKSALAAGLELPDHEDMKREKVGVDTGIVVKVPDTAYTWFKGAGWCKEGDRVAFAKYSGKVFRDPDDKHAVYLVVNDDDIIAVIGEDIDAGK
ncbi:hypothetical protein [uncultured Paraglaciecola sp.]|uniref:hypothetical protein n=1 Tax=uncultured Paraglaciecola sp. TaxID=1765024 RepID=UPI0026153196|nr:hypothetical protein [uncultured Paraglaciecola sp.]